MPKHLIFGIVGLLAGLVIGFFGANSINRDAALPVSVAPRSTTSAGSGAAVQPPGGIQPDVAETIAKADGEPQNFAIQMTAGDLYAKIGKFDKAIEFYSRGISLKPSDFQANVVLANAYFDSGKFEDAAKYYEIALAIKPADVNARTDFGTTFVERAAPNYERAITEYRAALEVDPKNEPALYYLGIAYLRKGDKDNAAGALAALEKTNPTSDLVPRLKQNMAAK